MLVGELVNVAKLLRDQVGEIKKGVAKTIETGDKIIKAGQAAYSSIKAKVEKDNARKAKAKLEAEKAAKAKEKEEKKGVQQ